MLLNGQNPKLTFGRKQEEEEDEDEKAEEE